MSILNGGAFEKDCLDIDRIGRTCRIVTRCQFEAETVISWTIDSIFALVLRVLTFHQVDFDDFPESSGIQRVHVGIVIQQRHIAVVRIDFC